MTTLDTAGLLAHGRTLAAEQGHEVRATIEALCTQVERAARPPHGAERARGVAEDRGGDGRGRGADGGVVGAVRERGVNADEPR